MPGGRRRPYRLADLRNGFLAGLALFAFSEADPFGIDDATERYSAEVFQRFAAPHYDRAQSDRIRVLLMTERLVEARGDWPLPFSVHGEILFVLLATEPAAVFVDFGFLDERGDSSVVSLQDAIGAYAADGVDLYFVAGQPGPGRPRGIIEPLSGAALVSGAFWPDRYELFDCRLGLPSAALALASKQEVALRGLKGAPSHLSEAHCPPAPSLRQPTGWPFRPPGCAGGLPGGDPRLCMDIAWSDWTGWGSGTNKAQRCKALPRWGPLILFDPFYAFLNRLGLEFVRPFGGQTCGPHGSLTAQDLLAAERAAATTADEAERQRLTDELRGYFKDRIVIYGGHLEMAEDLFQPPTHQPLPGAYYHAMALDNLLHLGFEGYKVQVPHLGGRPVGWLIEAVTFGLATAITSFFARAAIDREAPQSVPRERYPAVRRAHLLRSLRWSVYGLLALIVFLALLIWFEYVLLDWAPANFVGLIGFQFAWWISFQRTWWEHRPRQATRPTLSPE